MGRQQLIEKIINSVDIEKYQLYRKTYWCNVFEDFKELWEDRVINYHIKLLASEFLKTVDYDNMISVDIKNDTLFGGLSKQSLNVLIRVEFYNWLKSELNV